MIFINNYAQFPVNLFLIRLFLNELTFFIIMKIYNYSNKEHEENFTFYTLNGLIFLFASLVSTSDVGPGFAIGLFTIFSVLRYRTDQIKIKEMTYLFIAILIAVENSFLTIDLSLSIIILANALVILLIFILEKPWHTIHIISKNIIYDNIELLKKGRESEFIQDLNQRLGLTVKSFNIKEIDMLRDIAKIKIFYTEEKKPIRPKRF